MSMPTTASTSASLDVRYTYPDSSPHIARQALRQAAKQLTERGLASAAKWALELLVYVPKSEYDEIKSPRTAFMRFEETDDGMRDLFSRRSNNTSINPTDITNTPFPIHSTPAVGPNANGSGRFSSSLRMIPPSPFNTDDPSTLPPPPVTPYGLGHDTSHASSSSAHVRFAAAPDHSSASADHGAREGDHQNEAEEDVYMLAKNLFDHHQWDRCAALLRRENVRGPRALFLQLYSTYLIAERNAEEDYFQVSRRQRAKRKHRNELLPLLRQLIDLRDPFLLFLKGVLFRKLGKRVEAIDCFVRSLDLFPYNWSVWQELCTCMEGGQAELHEIAPMLPDSFMTSFFCELFARSAAARLQSDEVLRRVDALLTIFPNAPYLLVCRGQTLHLMQELEASEASYEAARAIDPHRLEGMADYSNSLFVQNKEEKLAYLTHSLAEAGREDAEVCCAVGNYHTLRGDNHRAVEVFKRGVRLDPSCASAWILLGHGYIELKDSMAAAEMYRKALELNPRDVRAWTGLGNTFELNGAWAQALHYHKRAAASSPYDFRFWASMANCYEKLGQALQAIECYKRILALEHHIDAQLAIMDNVARLYESLADDDDDGDDEEDVENADEGQAMHGGDDTTRLARKEAKAEARTRDLMRACAWHRRIVELIDRAHDGSNAGPDGREGHEGSEDSAEHAARVKEHVGSFLIAARWEMGMVSLVGDAQTLSQQQQDDMDDDLVMDVDGETVFSRSRVGNVTLAHAYLQRVIMTGTEAVLEAEELLKRLALLRT